VANAASFRKVCDTITVIRQGDVHFLDSTRLQKYSQGAFHQTAIASPTHPNLKTQMTAYAQQRQGIENQKSGGAKSRCL